MMNIFDVGGITTAIAVIATIIIGTGIFALINKISTVHVSFSKKDYFSLLDFSISPMGSQPREGRRIT